MDDYVAGVKRSRVSGPEEEDEECDGMEERHLNEDCGGTEEEHEHQQEQTLNGQVLYDVSEASRSHGRFAIAHGAIRAADVRATANGGRGPQASSSMSKQSMARQLAHQCRQNAMLQEENQRLSAAQAIGTGSSHAASESANDGIDAIRNNVDQDVSDHDCSNQNSENHAAM